MITPIDYSIVVPVYNAEKTLEVLFLRIQNIFDQLGASYEVIFVEDCGKDESWKIICSLRNRFPELVKAIKLAKNFGQHNAIMCAFNYVRGKYIITIDDDLQIPPEEIPKLILEQKRSQCDLIYGTYASKKHDVFRNLGSRIVQVMFRHVFKTSGDITAFRLISAHLIEKVKRHQQSFVFLDGIFHWYTQYVSRVTVNHEPRQEGRSGYTFSKLIRLASNLIFNFTTVPLRFASYLGFFISIVSFVTGIVFTVRKFVYDVPMGYTSIIVAIFFMSGIVLLVIGVAGEYLSRLYSLQNDKPQYSINDCFLD